MVTIKDIAKHANVSIGTVSNVLTGNRPVAEATRQRVLQVIEKFGYQPNMLGRSLVNQRSEMISVVTLGSQSYGKLYGSVLVLMGIGQETSEQGYSLQLTSLHDLNKETAHRALSSLVSRQVDGIISLVPDVRENQFWIGEKQLAHLPPLMFIGCQPRPGYSVVVMDDHNGGLKATQHLIDVGCKRIGHIAGPLDWLLNRQRRAGWCDALQAAGLPTDRSLQTEGDFSAASGEAGFARLLAQRPNIDGIFAGNDEMALGALRAAHLRGIRVPEDIAIVGFDNIPESAYLWPALSTVQHDLIEVGRIAARQLHRMIEAKQRGEDGTGSMTVVIEPRLIVRESSQRPASLNTESAVAQS